MFETVGVSALVLGIGLLSVSLAATTEIFPNYIEQGDLVAIKKHGYLRIMLPVPTGFETYLPRRGFPLYYESVLLENFAHSQRLKPKIIYVQKRDELIPSLLAGQADIIGANLTITKKRKKKIAFTVPYETVHEQVVSTIDAQINSLAQLAGHEISIHRSSSFWDTVRGIQLRVKNIRLKAVAETIPTEMIVEGVATGEYELTVADSNLVAAYVKHNPKLKAALNLTRSRPIAWGVRPDASELRNALNEFIEKQQWLAGRTKLFVQDWAGIKKRGIIRVLTRNNASTYFIWRGELMGFEYDLMRRFAAKQQLKVEMIVPPNRSDLLPWLKQGKGDIVAASMTINAQRLAQNIAFTKRYNRVKEMIVTRADDTAINKIEDLAGRTVVVRKSSSYWHTLSALQTRGIAVKIQIAPEAMETEEIIDLVADGKYAMTVADSHIFNIALTTRTDIRSALILKDNVLHAWAVRKGATELLLKLNAFIKKEYRGKIYNITARKYFKNKRSIIKNVTHRVDWAGGKISPFEALTKKYASRYGFDWLFVTAQMYQESGFDPNAKSWVGALGLMQVMPRTGRQVGISKLTEPANGLHAGVKYLAWLRNRFENELSVKDRTWFVLAAYNAGLGHVNDARTLAKRQGWDRNLWFNHVERAMLLLAKPKYHKRARHGYVRGYEPVQYVRKIRNRYNAYLRLLSKFDPGHDKQASAALATHPVNALQN